MTHPSRRQFIGAAACAVTAASAATRLASADETGDSSDPPYKISLAQWSLHRTLRDESAGVTNLDFPAMAKEKFDIDAIEYVNQFWKDKATDRSYLQDLKTRCDDAGVKSLLIMVDGEGKLGDPDDQRRKQSVTNHRQWLEAAKFLGCHSIRVNASSEGDHREQSKLAADGLAQLSEIAAPMGLNVLVENHGGWSSHGGWLSSTIKKVGMDNCGTLPDFGNFYLTRGDNALQFDRYIGVQRLMPMAKAVSAKSHAFDGKGNETSTNYRRMMKVVCDAGYHGYVGIEYEGDQLDEATGILKTRNLLRRVAKNLST